MGQNGFRVFGFQNVFPVSGKWVSRFSVSGKGFQFFRVTALSNTEFLFSGFRFPGNMGFLGFRNVFLFPKWVFWFFGFRRLPIRVSGFISFPGYSLSPVSVFRFSVPQMGFPFSGFLGFRESVPGLSGPFVSRNLGS